MQNYNPGPPPQQPPPGGYGNRPQPPAKKGMSTGVKVLIVVLVLVVGGGVLLAIAGGGMLWYFSRKAQETVSAGRTDALKGLTGTTSGGAEAEAPSPTAEQQAAIAGGQTAEWEQQDISWTVPQKWKKYTAESQSFMWRSPGSWDAASLIVSVAPMSADFPAEISLQSYYDSFKRDKQKYTEVRWIKLGGVKGVMFREASPESSDDPQRLQWIGYRDYKGQKQYVTIMLASQGKYFAQHEDAMYGVLYSTEMGE
jgi:archaellin